MAPGDMVPFTAFTAQSWDQQAQSLARYGGTRAMQISGEAAQGVSSGTAMDVMEELAALAALTAWSWDGRDRLRVFRADADPVARPADLSHLRRQFGNPAQHHRARAAGLTVPGAAPASRGPVTGWP
ncbi:hypothetical protein DPM13_15345 [Paracoccus mutanolyticus]|uniref:Uncharacterized protein n=1 Tax=Paracoccus mutanolyticus TaxID=1499308 RepID=A0ABN5MB71_9RHOB|nr:hypothetical protein DPM13_15345 [Paracoccus mutanolyticus]